MRAGPGPSRNRRPPPLRQTSMTATPGHPGRRLPALLALALAAAATTACSSHPAPAKDSIPAVFRPACGYPGAKVTVTRLPVTIPHKVCDLTRVLIVVPGRGGMVVPDSAGGVGNSAGLQLTVDDHTLDVTLTATGPPGNA